MGRLDGKVAVITGGASGIGEATVRLFTSEGAHAVIADVQDDRGRRLADELGTRASFQHVDVTREADIRAVVADTVVRQGKLDCLFNNAGSAGVTGGIETISSDGFDETIAVLLRGVLLGMKHAAPVMKRQGSGSIISTASVAGLRAGYGPHVYSAAKAAVVQLTRSVSMELSESGVRVNCICPGGIATPIFGKSVGLSPEAADQTVGIMKEALATLHPIGRSGLPDDIAHAALWLASDDSSFVNGHALVVDGGLIGGRKWSDQLSGRAMLRQLLGVSDA